MFKYIFILIMIPTITWAIDIPSEYTTGILMEINPEKSASNKIRTIEDWQRLNEGRTLDEQIKNTEFEIGYTWKYSKNEFRFETEKELNDIYNNPIGLDSFKIKFSMKYKF